PRPASPTGCTPCVVVSYSRSDSFRGGLGVPMGRLGAIGVVSRVYFEVAELRVSARGATVRPKGEQPDRRPGPVPVDGGEFGAVGTSTVSGDPGETAVRLLRDGESEFGVSVLVHGDGGCLVGHCGIGP